MKLVFDSSVALKWVVPETDSDKADALRNDFLTGAAELIAPDIFPIEAAHALTRAERQLRVSVGQARILLADLLSTCPRLYSYQPLLSRAVDISSQLRIGVYDCLYLALAEQEGCDFVTADTRLVANASKQFPFVVNLS